MAARTSGSPGRRRRLPTDEESGSAAEPRPLDVDGVGTALVGTIAWVVALVALVPFYSTLREQGRDWWIWTCLAGVGLGLIGFEYCRRRRARLRA